MNIKNVINIIYELRETNSIKEKELILRNHKDNNDLKIILEYTLNPFKRYGISESTYNSLSKIDFNDSLDNIFEDSIELIDLLNELIENNINDNLRKKFAFSLSKYSDDEKEIIKGIVTKDLKIGISSTTINKVWKKLIPKFEVQLAKKYSDVKLSGNELIFITEKLDGIRCVIIKENNNIKFYTRQGKEILGLNDIKNDLLKIFKENSVVLDGELLAKNDENLNSGDLYRKTTKIVNSKMENKTGIEFHVFDMMSPEEFQNGESKDLYRDRRSKMMSYIINTKNIVLVPTLYQGNDHNKIFEILKEVENKDKEGIMINLNEVYKCKRNNGILKVKTMESADLKIIGYEEGTGINKSKLGSFIVDYKGNEVKVGSGFTHEEREKFWEIKESLIDRIIEVQYFEESKNEHGGLSLRFPVFLRLRNIDKEISYN